MRISRTGFLLFCGAAVFVATIVNSVLRVYNVQVLMENEREVDHAYKVMLQLKSLLTSLVDVETGLRGFVITRQEEFLKPYDNALLRVDEEFTTLNELLADNPRRREKVAQLRALHDRREKFFGTVLESVRENESDAVKQLVSTREGKSLMDEMRDRVAELSMVQEALLRDRNQVAHDQYRLSIVTGVAGAFFSLTLVTLAIAIFWRELRIRRAAETSLQVQVEETRLNAERFRLLTESVPIHIWMSRPDGTSVFLNKSWQDYTGLGAASAGVADWRSAIHPQDVVRLQGIWDRYSGGTDLYLDEIRVLRKSDQTYRWHRCAVVPIRIHGVLQNWVGSLADIQDQKEQSEYLENAVRVRTLELRETNATLQAEVLERSHAEQRVQEVATELKRSNEELEKFAYVASHDLQEPLRKIQAFGDRLERKCGEALDEQSRGYLDRMLDAATRMRTLINDLLAFSRVATSTTPYDNVDLDATLANVLSDLEASVAQSQARIDVSPLPTIKAEPLQMRQLIQNLIGNALKFAKPGEAPVVSIEAMPLSDLEPGTDPPPPSFSGWRLIFADHGIGFEQSHENRIFEIFQRLHGRSQYEGTGIGLAICRKIVECHGGSIHVRAKPDEGATFFVDLPESPTGPNPPAPGDRTGISAASALH